MEWCYTYGLRNWHEVLHGNRNALTHPWVLAVLLAMLVFFFFFFSGRCLMMWFLSAWAPVEFFFCVPRASYFHGDDGSWTCGGWLRMFCYNFFTVILSALFPKHILPIAEMQSSSSEKKVALDYAQQTLRPSRPKASFNHPTWHLGPPKGGRKS